MHTHAPCKKFHQMRLASRNMVLFAFMVHGWVPAKSITSFRASISSLILATLAASSEPVLNSLRGLILMLSCSVLDHSHNNRYKLLIQQTLIVGWNPVPESAHRKILQDNTETCSLWCLKLLTARASFYEHSFLNKVYRTVQVFACVFHLFFFVVSEYQWADCWLE